MDHSDWMLQVTRLVLTNQTALFQHSNATFKFVYAMGHLIWICLGHNGP